MKYAVIAPLAVFCCESRTTPKGIRSWLDVGSLATSGRYNHTRRIHNLLIQLGEVWPTDSISDVLPNGQTPLEYADELIDAINQEN